MSIGTMRAALPLLLVITFAVPSPAVAQVEIEADPFAYALNGFSLHVARVVGSVRLNVGTFGIDVPRFLHGNEGWDASMRGAGLKVDWLGSDIDGFFIGVDGGYMRFDYTRRGHEAIEKRDEFAVGVRGGYRLPIGGRGLYVAPWMGVGYTFGGDDVVVAGELFERSTLTLFPTVHIGWRF